MFFLRWWYSVFSLKCRDLGSDPSGLGLENPEGLCEQLLRGHHARALYGEDEVVLDFPELRSEKEKVCVCVCVLNEQRTTKTP